VYTHGGDFLASVDEVGAKRRRVENRDWAFSDSSRGAILTMRRTMGYFDEMNLYKKKVYIYFFYKFII
jgi:hypothetical protein